MKKLVFLTMFFMAVTWPSLTWGQRLTDKRTYINQAVIGDGWRIVLDCVNRDPVEFHHVGVIFHLFDSGGHPPTGEFLVSGEDDYFPPFHKMPAQNKMFAIMSPNNYQLFSVARESPGLVIGWLEIIQDNDTTEFITCSMRTQFFLEEDFVTEAGVSAVLPASSYIFTVFAAEEASQKTGMAIANITSTASNWVGEAIKVTFTLTKKGSSLNGLSRTRTITPGGHLSLFWTELFPEYQNDPLWREHQKIAGVISITGKKVADGSPASLVVTVFNTRVTAIGFSISPVAATAVIEGRQF